MSNITSIRNEDANDIQIARAKYLHGVLKGERWSITAAATALGIPKSTLHGRMNGSTPLLFDDVAMIATLLKRDPIDLYRELLGVGPTRLERVTSTVVTGRLADILPFKRASGF